MHLHLPTLCLQDSNTYPHHQPEVQQSWKWQIYGPQACYLETTEAKARQAGVAHLCCKAFKGAMSESPLHAWPRWTTYKYFRPKLAAQIENLCSCSEPAWAKTSQCMWGWQEVRVRCQGSSLPAGLKPGLCHLIQVLWPPHLSVIFMLLSEKVF